MWPARSTRDGLSRWVRASTALPLRDVESVGLLAQRRLDRVGNRALVARFAGNVDEGRGQRDRVATQIQAHEPQD
jgi:hypothetical protein